MRLPGGWRPRADGWLLVAVWIALVALFALTTESFLSVGTFRMLAGRLPALVVAAVGMTLVVISGGIDLAVGSVAALAAAAAASPHSSSAPARQRSAELRAVTPKPCFA